MDAESIFYRRTLPHWQPPGASIFITWRLQGSLPRIVITRLRTERERLDKKPRRPNESAFDRNIRHNKIIFKIAGRFVPLRQITQGLKGYVAREANLLLGRTGQRFWQIESYDHWSRSIAETKRIIAYIENNPAKAGLVAKPEDWRWSSAWEREFGRLKGQEL